MRKVSLKSVGMTLLAILVMSIILFPVYYIFIVSISPTSTLATTELHLIPRNVSLNSYREVLFGLSGNSIVTNFTGTIRGDAYVKDGRLYVTKGVMTGKIKYGPFTGAVITVNVSNIAFAVNAPVAKGTLNGKIRGLLTLTELKNGGKIGFAIIRDVTLTEGKVGNINVAGKMQGYIIVRGNGKASFTLLGKFVNSTFFKYLKNSIILAGLTVLLALFFVVPAAYAFSRMKFFGREHVLYFYLMFTQVAGGLGIAGLIALYGMVVKLGLYDKLPALSLIYAAGSVPFNTWLLKGYIDSISPDFDEAALVDGASYLQIIRYVLLPMALPGIATVAIFAFIGGWTEFILASLLLGQENQPLAVWIYTLLGGIGRGIDWSYFAAAALLFALPVFVTFMLAQNYIRSGLTVGGLKE
ncbi:ABC transporter permease subunit [Thermococcus sp.]|uniref:ABC transporter permease subunit n=1 Tax=Thermococcus sp. TaxID=35749 RepID=UPI0026294284|nr:ABC transporter permease subunit [Thermococcus sp.]